VRYRNDSRGFTLIELLTVIALLGVIAAIAIPQFLIYYSSAFDSRAVVDLSNAYRISMQYFAGEPNGTLTMADLNELGFVPSDGVNLFIDNGALAGLRMRSFHDRGSQVYVVDNRGRISY